MAVDTLPKIIDVLVANGLDADTPGAVIMSGSTMEQREVTAPLSSLVDRMRHDRIANPAVVVIGAVVELRDQVRRISAPAHAD